MTIKDLFNKITEHYPFISRLEYGKEEYIGIIQNKDKLITSFYDYSKINNSDEKKKFLELGDIWWWESNRQIPINIFLKEDWEPFSYTLMTVNSKNCDILNGPYVSLSEISVKRVKRTNIQLIRRTKK